MSAGGPVHDDDAPREDEVDCCDSMFGPDQDAEMQPADAELLDGLSDATDDDMRSLLDSDEDEIDSRERLAVSDEDNPDDDQDGDLRIQGRRRAAPDAQRLFLAAGAAWQCA